MTNSNLADTVRLAAPDPPTNDEAAGVQASGFDRRGSTECVDYAAIATNMEGEKRFANLRAELALAGHELRSDAGVGGGAIFIVKCWGMQRQLADLDEVARWLAMVTGRRVE